MNVNVSLTPPQKITLLNCRTNSFVGMCRGCWKEVEMVSFQEAVQIVGVGLDEIINKTASGSLHLGIRPEALLICLDSLLQADFRKTKIISN